MSEKINAALIGLTAPHSKGWLGTLQHLDLVDRLVVCDEECPELEVPGRCDQTYTTVEQMLQNEALDFALVSMFNDQAPQTAQVLLEAGIPLIIEKPVGRTAAAVRQLNDVAARCGVPWATGFLNRYLPVVQEFKSLVEAGALGRIVSIEGRMLTSSVQQRNPAAPIFSHQRSGGGILHWLGIHTIDLIRYISGLEYHSVMGQVATLSDSEIDVEDMAAASFTMDNGALGNLHCGYVLRQRYGDIYLSMRGTLGEVVWQMHDFDGAGNTLKVHSQDADGERGTYKEITVLPTKEGEGYGGQMGQCYVGDFIRAARRGQPFVTDGQDALRALELIEAINASSASGSLTSLSEAP